MIKEELYKQRRVDKKRRRNDKIRTIQAKKN